MMGCLGKLLMAGAVTGGLVLGGCALVMGSCAAGADTFARHLQTPVKTEDVVAVVDAGVEKLGSLLLVGPARIEGELERSANGYAGTYRRTCEDANETWALFGGADLDAHTLTVRCDLSATTGAARLVLRGTEGTRTIARSGETTRETINLEAGANYLVLELEGCSGTVDISVDEGAETQGAPSA